MKILFRFGALGMPDMAAPAAPHTFTLHRNGRKANGELRTAMRAGDYHAFEFATNLCPRQVDYSRYFSMLNKHHSVFCLCVASLRWALVMISGALLLWFLGLLWFQHAVQSYANPQVRDATQVDAIVVLTGGSARLDAGIHLLADKRAPRLLVSGVAEGVTVPQLLKANQLQKAVPADQVMNIHLGYRAADTTGNALELAEWAEKYQVSSIILVTSNYHMPRSLLECRHVMPQLKIIPYAVLPERVKTEEWLWSEGTRELFVEQYNKYLGVLVRTTLQRVLA